METNPWVDAVLNDIRNTSSVLNFLHVAALRGEVLVGCVRDVHGLTEWYLVSPGQNSLLIWEPYTLEFFMENDPTESVIVGVQYLNHPLRLFPVSRLDVPSLQFSKRSRSAWRRLAKAELKRRRRFQKNRSALPSLT